MAVPATLSPNQSPVPSLQEGALIPHRNPNAGQDHLFALMDRLPGGVGAILAKYIHGAAWHVKAAQSWAKLKSYAAAGVAAAQSRAADMSPKEAKDSGYKELIRVLQIFETHCRDVVTYNQKMDAALKGESAGAGSTVEAAAPPSTLAYPAGTSYAPSEEGLEGVLRVFGGPGTGWGHASSSSGHGGAASVAERIATPPEHQRKIAYWQGLIKVAAEELRDAGASARRKAVLKTLIAHGREEISFHAKMARLLLSLEDSENGPEHAKNKD